MFQVNIKNLLLASAVAICAATPSLSQALADLDFGPFHPLFGVDGQHRKMKFQEGFGDNLWKETYPQTNLYAGLRFGSYFGFVVGHENSKSRSQNVRLSPGEAFLGQPLAAFTNFRTSTEIKGTYAQVMGYLPISFIKSTELFLGIGAIHNKLNLEFQVLDGLGINDRNYQDTDTHAKVEFGIQKIICNHFGLRVVGGWENTSSFEKLKPVQAPAAVTEVNLNDTWTVGAGFFWLF